MRTRRHESISALSLPGHVTCDRKQGFEKSCLSHVEADSLTRRDSEVVLDEGLVFQVGCNDDESDLAYPCSSCSTWCPLRIR